MPPKPEAVKGVSGPSEIRMTRLRSKQLQPTPVEAVVSDAGHLDISRAMSSAPKQNAAARRRGPWGEDYLMTSTKSALVNADLVKLFANPKAWECLEEDEKRELLSLLPAHIHPNPEPDPDNSDSKIAPLPESFLRYDNNWRSALRNFQNDLESGRYKPEWQRQARQAAQERAQGNFDNFKEREFEQFWGQKQKVHHGIVAGESSKVKLETLIQHEIVRVGDVWKYSRIFGAKNGTNKQIVVEKEVKITAIDGATLSFLVPVGQRVFLCALNEPAKDIEDGGKEAVADETPMDIDSKPIVHEDGQALSNEPSIPSNMVENPDHESPSKLETEIKKEDIESKEDDSPADHPMIKNAPDGQPEPPPKRGRGGPRKKTKTPEDGVSRDTAPETKASEGADTEASRPIENNTSLNLNLDLTSVGNKRKTPDDEAFQDTAPEPKRPFIDADTEATLPIENSAQVLTSVDEKEKEINESPPASMDVDSPQVDNNDRPSQAEIAETPQPKDENSAPSPRSPSLEIEIRNIAGPNAIAKKILEIDGRVRNPPNGNAWKELRCIRNNQDMGALWDVRQAWYLKFQPEED